MRGRGGVRRKKGGKRSIRSHSLLLRGGILVWRGVVFFYYLVGRKTPSIFCDRGEKRGLRLLLKKKIVSIMSLSGGGKGKGCFSLLRKNTIITGGERGVPSPGGRGILLLVGEGALSRKEKRGVDHVAKEREGCDILLRRGACRAVEPGERNGKLLKSPSRGGEGEERRGSSSYFHIEGGNARDHAVTREEEREKEKACSVYATIRRKGKGEEKRDSN